MDRHVSHGPTSVVVPSPPIPGMEMALRERTLGCRTEPQIPIQRFGNWRWFRIGAFVPPRLIAPRVGFTNLSNDPALDQLHRGPVRACGMDLRSHLRDKFCFFRDQAKLSRFVDVVRQRLLAINVLAMVHRGHGRCRMRVIRCGNMNRIDLVGHLIKHLAKVGEPLRLGMLFTGCSQIVCIDIAERDDVDFGVGAEGP